MSSVYVLKQRSVRPKKRPRRCVGVKESKTKLTVKPRPVKTASGKKLAPSPTTSITIPSSVTEVSDFEQQSGRFVWM